MFTSAFYFISFVTIFCALMVVVSQKPIHSVLYLVLTFFCISANYIFMLDATFIGMVNVIVYAGAIMVLFLYVLMMMNPDLVTEQKRSVLFKVSAAIAAGLLLLVIVSALKDASLQSHSQAATSAVSIGSIKSLGYILYSRYQLPFEIASILFLVAMIGAIVLGKKDTKVRTIGMDPVQ